MTKLDAIFQEKFTELNNGIISILLVHLDEIKALNPNTDMGFIRSSYSGDIIDRVQILIDKNLEPEMKLNVMFHEYGHAKHWVKLGAKKIEELRQDDFSWVVNDEYEAFKYQLEEIRIIAIQSDIILLRNLIDRLEYRKTNDCDYRYKAALDKLFAEQIWSECKSLVNLN